MRIEGVITAAGYSSRAGRNKMTWPVLGKTVLERCMESMLASCRKVIVIGGFQFESLVPLVSQYKEASLVFNPNYPEGMFSSVLEGLRHTSGDRLFITPGDCPLIRPETYKKLLSVDSDVVIPTWRGTPGHPVLLSNRVSRELADSQKYKTLKEFIEDRDVVRVEVNDDGILFDADTPDDFVKLEAVLAGGAVKIDFEVRA